LTPLFPFFTLIFISKNWKQVSTDARRFQTYGRLQICDFGPKMEGGIKIFKIKNANWVFFQRGIQSVEGGMKIGTDGTE
jgi:hypothetical protein